MFHVSVVRCGLAEVGVRCDMFDVDVLGWFTGMSSMVDNGT